MHSNRTLSEKTASVVIWTVTIIVMFYLVVPIFAIVPLSFTSGSLLVFPIPDLSTRMVSGLRDQSALDALDHEQPHDRVRDDGDRDLPRHSCGARSQPRGRARSQNRFRAARRCR